MLAIAVAHGLLDKRLFWFDTRCDGISSNNGGVYTVPVAGGQQAALGTGQSQVLFLTVSNTHAFWLACRAWTSSAQTVIHQNELGGGNATIREEAGDRVDTIVADDEYVYYSADTHIWRMGY